MAKPAISILWLKRDLRWQDHAALQSALQAGLPLLAVYLKEPTQWAQIQYSERQWQFVWDSVAAMNEVLGQHKVHVLHCEALEFFEACEQRFEIKGIYSHQEVGIQWTFDRDLALAGWCKERNIAWHEYPTFGVARGLKQRKYWLKNWYTNIHAPIAPFNMEHCRTLLTTNPFPHWSAQAPKLAQNLYQRGG
ncbi:MAG: deoxyribodipyrimidine photo-lyase, partial [Schleiferiaceae bacterium]